MSSIAHRSSRGKTVPLISRFQRYFFAICIVLGIAVTLALVATSPQYYGVQNGIPVMVSTFATAHPLLMRIHFIVGTLTVYLLPVSLLAMAWLAMRRAPWLASIVALVLFITLAPLAAFSAQDALTYDLAHMGNNPLFVTIAQQFNDDGVMSYYNALFILGTVPGPALLGIALWRSRAVPRWAAGLIIIARPLVFFYPFAQNLIPAVSIQLITWSLLLIGSVPAALAMLKGSSSEEQDAADRQAQVPLTSA